MSGHLTIVTLGEFNIIGLTRPLGSRKASALLIYLAVADGKLVKREVLADLLWGGTGVKRARHSLSQVVYDLRASLPNGIVVCANDRIGLERTRYRIDYLDYSTALTRGDLAAATELYRGGFLDDYSYITDAFDDWRIETAACAHAQAVAAFNYLVSEALDQEDYATSAALANTALILSPFDPTLIKSRIESLAAAGDVGRALQELALARTKLRSELGHIPTALLDGLDQNLARLAKSPQMVTGGTLHARLVGRNAELAHVRRHWRSEDGGLRVVSIGGEPGIGKSRLLDHIIRRSVLDGDRAFVCRCTEAESRLPYATIVNLMRSTCRPEDFEALEANWVPILATIAPELFPNTSPAHGCTQRALWEAIAHFFLAAADRQPVVIGVDDLQWSDEVSKDVIRYISKRLADNRMLVIIAYRAPLELPVYEDDKPSMLALQLNELDQASTRELIRSVAEQYSIELTPAAWSVLTNQIGGRPFFLLEALRQFAGTFVQLNSLEDFRFSSDLERHLDQRLRVVGSHGRRVLDAVAILGRPSSLRLLSRITGLSPVEMAATGEELVTLGILTDVGETRFSHDLLREAQRRRIRESDALLWHARIAEILAQSEESHPGEVAFHYEESGQTEEARRFAATAKDQALAVHAYAEADIQFQRLIRCSPLRNRAEAEGEYVKWLARCARLKEIPVAGNLARYFAGKADHEGNLAMALAGFEQLERQGACKANALKDAAMQIVEYAQTHAPSLLTTVLWQVADTLRSNGELPLLAQLAAMIREQSDVVEPAFAVDMLSVSALLTAVSTGHTEATNAAEEAVLTAESTGDAMLLAKALYARGTIGLWAGRIKQAGRDYERLAQLADPVGPNDLVERMHSNASVLYLEQGKLDEAQQQAMIALQNTSRARSGYVYGNLCMIALCRDDSAAAERYAHALLDWNSARQHTWIPVNAEALLGLAELHRGDFNAASARADFVRSFLHTGHTIMDVAHAYLLIARVDDIQGKTEDAVEFLKTAARLVRRRDQLAGIRLHLERARLLAKTDIGRGRRIASAISRFADANGALTLANQVATFNISLDRTASDA